VHQKEPVREALVTKLQPACTGCFVANTITTLPWTDATLQQRQTRQPPRLKEFFFNPQNRRVNMQHGFSNQRFSGIPRFNVFAGGPGSLVWVANRRNALLYKQGALASSSWHAEQPRQ
jgi:hypothetical protein